MCRWRYTHADGSMSGGIKCGKCGEVFLHEVTMSPSDRQVTFSLRCPAGHDVTNAAGQIEVVDLKSYDQSKLRKVAVPAPN